MPRVIFHVEKNIETKFDIADVYHKTLLPLMESAKTIQMSPDDFFMMITSVSLKFMDETFQYKDIDELRAHMNQLCSRYWEHRHL